MADENLQHVFVTELAEAENALPNDYLLLSQTDDNGNYMSRKLQYSRLCATVLEDIDNKISSLVSAALDDLSLSVLDNTNDISALSASLGETTSAVIKIANCVQQNKANISALCSEVSSLIPIKDMSITGSDGISVQHDNATYTWNIKHSNIIDKLTEPAFNKIAYDNQGHITGVEAVASSDIVALGNFLTASGTGLSCNEHTVSLKQATADEIGGLKVNGNNLEILDGGILSARDSTYSSGTGISITTNNNISSINIVPAKSDNLGGIKVGANLSVSEDGTLCAAYIGLATSTSAGTIMLGYEEELSDKNYPVKALANGNAYVHVPWTDTSATFQTGTLCIDNMYAVISAVSYGKGNVTGISSSTALYDLVKGVSAYIQTGILSGCVQVGHGEIEYDNSNGVLTLRGGISGEGEETMVVDETVIPTIVSGEVVTSAYYKKEGSESEEEVISSGFYIKLGKNTAAQQSDNIYIDAAVLSSMYRTETWEFTLSDGTESRTVVIV